jgi:hypothetical protein
MYIYCVHSKATDVEILKKLGLTIHPQHRLRQYRIGDAPGLNLQKKYEGLWRIKGKTKLALRQAEMDLHTHFASKRLQADDGGSSEWFKVTFEEVVAFLDTHPMIDCRLTEEEIAQIHTKVSQPRVSADETDEAEELAFMKETLTEMPAETLYEKFCRIFLKGRLPRRVQKELWYIFTELCSSPDPLKYAGIVKWPTGVGKTIGQLMLIIIAADRCKRLGQVYRGLFVSPKNDILDTITHDFKQLKEFGIDLYDGSHGKLSSLIIPLNKNVLVIACQAALTTANGFATLPPMTHVHYDEVHRTTGDLYFKSLQEKLELWGTEILTGTSATPLTSSSSQQEKITELFGNPLTLLHECGVDEAVQQGWIAKPRFLVAVLSPIDDTDAHLRGFVEVLGKYILRKNTGGKFIAYIESSVDDVRRAAMAARELLPWAEVYTAIDDERTDKEFLAAPVDKTPRILFAFQRYREGSDIRGVEMTAKLVGNTSAAYIIIQVCGRAGRIDSDPNKEGWCLLVRPSEEGTTEQEVLESILLDVMEFLGKSDKPLTKKDVERLIRTYVDDDISMTHTSCTLEETIARVQAAYVRREYQRTPHATTVRKQCLANGIVHSSEYEKVRETHGWPSKPWDTLQLTPYEFFHLNGPRVEVSTLRDTLIERNIRTLQAYREQIAEPLPSVEDINDGYFQGITNLNDVLPSGGRRR